MYCNIHPIKVNHPPWTVVSTQYFFIITMWNPIHTCSNIFYTYFLKHHMIYLQICTFILFIIQLLLDALLVRCNLHFVSLQYMTIKSNPSIYLSESGIKWKSIPRLRGSASSSSSGHLLWSSSFPGQVHLSTQSNAVTPGLRRWARPGEEEGRGTRHCHCGVSHIGSLRFQRISVIP